MNSGTPQEDARQLQLLLSGPEQPDAGLVRYGAAMYFFGRGLIGAGTLEVYRICSPLDHENPMVLLEARSLAGELRMLQNRILKHQLGESP